MEKQLQEKQLIFKIKALTVFYIFARFFWGITAFPLETEMRIACDILGIEIGASPATYDGLKFWIATVAEGVVNTNRDYPFLAYGTDWLAFSHIVIGIAFLGVYFKPVTNIWIVYFGMIACIGVVPLALICGAVRDIPFYWRLIDCSFCLFGIIPLYFLLMYIRKLGKLINYVPTKY